MALRESLQPHSTMHRAADYPALRTLVQASEDIIQSLHQRVIVACAEDMQLAVKGIVQQRAHAHAKQEKPELQVEDDLDYSYMS